jgi:hypothetical protein
MARECGYHRPGDGAPCVMGSMHATNHYFAEAEPDEPRPLEASPVTMTFPRGEFNAFVGQEQAAAPASPQEVEPIRSDSPKLGSPPAPASDSATSGPRVG